MLVIGGPVIRMNERGQVAILQLDAAAYPKASRDRSHLFDNAQAMLHIALVVVRHLEDEERRISLNAHGQRFRVMLDRARRSWRGFVSSTSDRLRKSHQPAYR